MEVRERKVRYKFDFYKDSDYDRLVELTILSYGWEHPIVGMSRVAFARGLHPTFKDCAKAWEHTVGVYRENNEIIACVWNEGTYDGEVFFLFDSKERGQEPELLQDMIKFAKTYGAGLKAGSKTYEVNLFIPEWNKTLMKMAGNSGFKKGEWGENYLMLPFENRLFEVNLPEGYSIIDGSESPDFYLSNVHRFAFEYGGNDYACKHGEQAFHELRQRKQYNPKFDLCVLDEYKRPVAIAILWYDEKMPYCELEPLGVVWWERRKGLATAILHEAANRMMKAYPKCQGMHGGDQDFYRKIGYKEVDTCIPWKWEQEVYISWEPESLHMDYSKAVAADSISK